MKTALLLFNLHIKPQQIEHFRQACIVSSGDPHALFSNEEKQPGGNVRHLNRYPLIQYRCSEGRAALWAADAGIAAMDKWMKKPNHPFQFFDHDHHLQVWQRDNNKNETVQLLRGKQQYFYKLHHWIPFMKEENYQWWKNNRFGSDIEKTKKIETILFGHLANFTTEIAGWKKERYEKIKPVIIEKSGSFVVRHHDTGITAFNIIFSANIALPAGIGLGSLKSHGYGVLSEHVL